MQFEVILLLLQFVMPYQFLYYLQPIKEEQPQGTFVGNVKNFILENNALDKTYLDNSSFELFGKSSINRLLKLNKFSGVLQTKTRIDIDSLCESIKECCYNSKSHNTNTCSIELIVQVTYSKNIKILNFLFLVEDINDNVPQFEDKLHVLQIHENRLPMKIGSLPSAFDKDFGQTSKLEYRLHGNKDQLRLFSIKSIFHLNECKYELFSHISFDRESVNEYMFSLIAKDVDDNEAKIMIKVRILDENDSVPKFHVNSNKIQKFQIYENCRIGTEIILFNVTDADEGVNGEIVYSLNNEDRTKSKILPFYMSKKGSLFVSENIDREIREFYEITISASDNGIPTQMSSIKIHIEILDVNDNKPDFILQTQNILNHYSVEENSEIDTNIGTIEVIDKDKGFNSKITCHIEENSFSKYLKLEKIENFNIFKIQTRLAIDREKDGQLLMVLKCCDAGLDPLMSSVTITIDVVDKNDNIPIVDTNTGSLNWEISENNIKFSYINQVKATDIDIQDNGRLYYFINESDTLSMSQFSIDSETGVVKSKIVFDRELQDLYKFIVFIRDYGKPSLSTSATVTVTILDENDNFPMFFTANPLYLTIIENTNPPYALIHLTCKDRDEGINGKVSMILQENTDYFSLAENGKISLKRPIDRETHSEFKLKIIAKDHGLRPQSSSINVVIEVKDINDNSPTFIFPDKNLQMNVSFDYTVGKKLITKITAVDPDFGQNGVILFHHDELVLHSNKMPESLKDSKKFFSVNKDNGEITLINSLQPLFRRKCLIIIYAKDLGYPPLSSTVKIEISIVETKSSIYSNKISASNDHDIFNISVIIIGCISVIIITVMIGAVMMLIFQKERNHRYEVDSCLMTSLSGKLTSALNEYELSSPSSINKNLSMSSSNIHLMQEKNYISTLRPIKLGAPKYSNPSRISNYYEVIMPKETLNNQKSQKEITVAYHEPVKKDAELIEILTRNVADSS